MMATLFEDEIALFPTSYEEILQRIGKIDPVKYGATRNYVDGAVTYLSPYISRGVISTKMVFDAVIDRGYAPKQIEKFIQELAWRDYWQQVWIDKGNQINEDLKNEQQPVENTSMPKAISDAKTGLVAIDKAVREFYKTGYLHNHVRMYVASIACNIGMSHWKVPAQWMYYHLLDGDWASNALSWQWVAGVNSNKKYYANQENINKYCHTKQRNTFLDIAYHEFQDIEIPNTLLELAQPELKTSLHKVASIEVDSALPACIYTYYNLDPLWRKGEEANRILLLEPSHFRRYPISKKSVEFMLALSKNIEGIQVFVGEFEELIAKYALQNIYFKEHPLNRHFKGYQESRDWMFDVKGYYPSFFAFWKKCRKQLKY